MAEKRVYIGSTGPGIYDDTDALNDPAGGFSGYTREAVVTDGQMVVQGAPAHEYHVSRKCETDGNEDLAFFIGLL